MQGIQSASDEAWAAGASSRVSDDGFGNHDHSTHTTADEDCDAAGPSFSTFSNSKSNSSGMSHFDSLVSVYDEAVSGALTLPYKD